MNSITNLTSSMSQNMPTITGVLLFVGTGVMALKIIHSICFSTDKPMERDVVVQTPQRGNESARRGRGGNSSVSHRTETASRRGRGGYGRPSGLQSIRRGSRGGHTMTQQPIQSGRGGHVSLSRGRGR